MTNYEKQQLGNSSQGAYTSLLKLIWIEVAEDYSKKVVGGCDSGMDLLLLKSCFISALIFQASARVGLRVIRVC